MTPPTETDARAAFPRRAATILAWSLATLALAAAAVTVATTILGVLRARTWLPDNDEWELVKIIAQIADGAFDPAELVSQHNEHRILLPRLLFLVDIYVFGFRGTFNLIVVHVIQALHAVMLWRLITRATTWPRWIAPLTAGLVALALFSAYQMENLSWGFQSQFVGVFALATAACWALAASADALEAGHAGRSWALTAAAALAAISATYTLIAGVLTWPVLLVMAITMRLAWTRTLLVVGVGALAVGLYFTGFEFNPGHADPFDSLLHHPVAMWAYTAALLAFPITDNELGWTGVISGTAIGIGVGLFVHAAVQGRRGLTVAQWTLLGTCLFVIAFAIVTAAGRLNFGVEQAAAGRYKTPALVFWVATIGLFGSFAWQRRDRWVGLLRWPLAAFVGVLAVNLFTGQFERYDELRWKQLHERLSAASFLLGFEGDPTHTKLYPSLTKMQERIEVLRAEKMSIFLDPEAGWVGRKINDVLDIDQTASPSGNPAACIGSFDGFLVPKPARSVLGRRFAGWAWDVAADKAPRVVVGVDEGGTIAALAYPGWRRPDLPVALGDEKYREAAFIGSAVSEPGVLFSAYAVLADGTACALPGRHAFRKTFPE